MKYDELKNYVKQASLSMKDFASLLGYEPESLSNLKKKEHIPNNLAVIVVLMAELQYHKIDFRQVLEKANIKSITKKPRVKKFQGKSKAMINNSVS